MAKTLLAFSGGLDSTVLLWELLHRGLLVECVTVDYGQPAREELIAASRICARAKVEQHLVQIQNLQVMLGAGAGPFPGKRLILISLAVAIAAARECDTVAYGERIDTGLPDWHYSAHQVVHTGHRGAIGLYAPYQDMTKESIIRRGRRLKAPLRSTWSCHLDGVIHCGQCRSCTQRLRAFRSLEWPDPTNYRDAEPTLFSRLRPYLGPDLLGAPDYAG